VDRASNTGQACLAPDCLLVEATVRDAFPTRLVEALRAAAAAQAGRIVDRRHFDRLAGLLRDSGGEVVGGAVDETALRMGPAVVIDPVLDSRLMRDEIFGPILPILTVASIDEAVRFVRQRPDPLALYVFTESAATADAVLGATTSGTAAVITCSDSCWSRPPVRRRRAVGDGGLPRPSRLRHELQGLEAWEVATRCLADRGEDSTVAALDTGPP
jgi:acyl-CoA reductase-like NAD-dependent aldehyde dehydrogenase